MKRILVVAGLTVLVMGFQNCAKTTFGSSSGEDLSSKGSLAAIPLDAEDGSVNGQISQPSESMPPSVPMPPSDDKKKDPKNYEVTTDDSSSDDNSEDSDLVACILVDHGKSLKLGFVADKLEGVNAVSQSVCLSRHACLDIVSKAFPVEGAYERGYCEHNPHILRLKDAEVDALIKKLLPQ